MVGGAAGKFAPQLAAAAHGLALAPTLHQGPEVLCAPAQAVPRATHRSALNLSMAGGANGVDALHLVAEAQRHAPAPAPRLRVWRRTVLAQVLHRATHSNVMQAATLKTRPAAVVPTPAVALTLGAAATPAAVATLGIFLAPRPWGKYATQLWDVTYATAAAKAISMTRLTVPRVQRLNVL